MSGGRGARTAAAIAATALVAAVCVSAAAAKPKPEPHSPFVWRGVIQAAYGRQFSTAERRRLLRFIAGNGFNAYVHAPKGDPYQRTLWRDPYPPPLQAEFDAEVQLGVRLGVDWIPNVSPAAPAFASPGDAAPPGTTPSAPICFSRASDLDQLVAKVQPFLAAGSRAVMVSFDDVKLSFSCDADAAAYGTGAVAFGRAAADLLNRLDGRLQAFGPIQLLTVAPDYYGIADTGFLQGFRGVLAPGIDVMWTGPNILSSPFTGADADAYARLIGREPTVWENWTADDLFTYPGMNPLRIFLGPYARDADVVGHVRGFFFNPANQSDLNFLPLATAGRWMLGPKRYRPRQAFLEEVSALAGSESPALRAFAEANYSTTLRPGVEAPTLTRLMRRFLAASNGIENIKPQRGGRLSKQDSKRLRLAQAAAAPLRSELLLAITAKRHLRRVRSLGHFVRQALPYLRSVRLNARAALLATELLEELRPGKRQQLRRRLRTALDRARSVPEQTYGTRTDLYGLAGSVIDSYVARVMARDHKRGRPVPGRAGGG